MTQPSCAGVASHVLAEWQRSVQIGSNGREVMCTVRSLSGLLLVECSCRNIVEQTFSHEAHLLSWKGLYYGVANALNYSRTDSNCCFERLCM